MVTLHIATDVRIVGGKVATEGRVEVFYGGQWGTVCDDDWDIADANVVCRQLGFPGATTAWQSAHFGQGPGQILMDDVNCVGNEERLQDCVFRGWSISNCSHSNDASVTCEPGRCNRHIHVDLFQVCTFFSGWGFNNGGH